VTVRLTSEHLRAAVESAEAVTSGVSDPQLRAIAFGRVLDHLLAGGATQSPTQIQREGTEPPRHRAPSGVRPPSSRSGPSAWINSLRDEGFFTKQKPLAEVTEAVRAQGHNIDSKNVTDPLERLVQSKVLRRERKPTDGSTRVVWLYSNY
jgi:hypothetical protein